MTPSLCVLEFALHTSLRGWVATHGKSQLESPGPGKEGTSKLRGEAHLPWGSSFHYRQNRGLGGGGQLPVQAG